MKLEKIQKKIDKLTPTWVGEKSVPAIIRGLNKAFYKSIVYFSSARHKDDFLPDHSVIVSGQYCPRIFSAIPENILITLNFPAGVKKVTITEEESKNLALRIMRAIHHEYRHKHQQKGRGYVYTKQYTPKKKQHKLKAMYYGNPDEIDAHAYETQAEHLNINILRKAHKVNWTQSESIYMYRLNFRKSDPKIWKRFLKKVYKLNANIQTVSNGARNNKSR